MGLTLTAAAGVGLGVFAGMAIGQLLGSVDTERVRRAVGHRLRRSGAGSAAPAEGELERAVNGALSENATTRHLAVRAHALGDGIVELTGTAPDPEARALAGTIARGVAGSGVIVNRILVEGEAPGSRRRKPPRAG
jgi:osmotically-inducible protein OsmY